MTEFNINSSQQLAGLLFGMTTKIQSKVAVVDASGRPVLIKSGQNKGSARLQNKIEERRIKGFGLKASKDWLTPTGKVSTNADVLQKILDTHKSDNGKYSDQKTEDLVNLLTFILRIRKVEKQLQTYYVSTKELIFKDGCVHARFNHVSTDTGRLSSENPNMQNQSGRNGSLVKEHFTSRYRNGRIVNADFSQLEIAVQAQLSQDLKLIQDLCNGIDMHCVRVAFKTQKPYEEVFKYCKIDKNPEWIGLRDVAKEFSFQRAYGATANSIARDLEVPKAEIEKLEQADLKLYPTLARWNYQGQIQVERQGYYTTFTGRRWYFERLPETWYYKEYKMGCWYSPTKVKNFRTQGTACDLVMFVLGRLWRKSLHHRDKYLLINTVHDSIMADCKPWEVEFCKKVFKETLEDFSFLERRFHEKLVVPLKVDVTDGKTWLDAK